MAGTTDWLHILLFRSQPSDMSTYTLEPVSVIRSALKRLEDAPLQGDEGAPEAWLDITPKATPGLMGIEPGDELIVLTWLHLAERDVLQVHPRGDREERWRPCRASSDWRQAWLRTREPPES